MNDLTFGATLLSCLGLLAVAVIVESTSPAPARSADPVAARLPAPAAVHMAAAAACDCLPLVHSPAVRH